MSFFLVAFCFIRVAGPKWYIALFWAFVSIGVAYLLFDILLKSSLQGNFSIFFTRPFSAVLICASILLLFLPVVPGLGKRRVAIVKEVLED